MLIKHCMPKPYALTPTKTYYFKYTITSGIYKQLCVHNEEIAEMSFLEFYKFYWVAPQSKIEELHSEIDAVVDEDASRRRAFGA